MSSYDLGICTTVIHNENIGILNFCGFLKNRATMQKRPNAYLSSRISSYVRIVPS